MTVHISTTSNMLDKLAKAELVQRTRSETDRRVVNLSLTAKGASALARAPKPLTGLVPHALENLPEPALTQLHADLELLIQHMKYVDVSAADKPLSRNNFV